MQRVSNVFLAFALTAFVTAVSLALMAAAWLMAVHILNGPTRLVPKWLFAGVLAVVFTQVTAQTVAGNTLVVIAERTQPANGPAIVSYHVAILPDTLSQPVVQRSAPARKQFIAPEPAWPTDNNLASEGQTMILVSGPNPQTGFYSIGITQRGPLYKSGAGYWRHP